jgi:hypothetical protein
VINIKKKYAVFIIIILFVVLFVFSHSTPQRAIRTNLIFKGYPVKALQTEVYKSAIDIQYGQFYSCKNPGIGSDFYSCKKVIFGLWFIDWTKTGGG